MPVRNKKGDAELIRKRSLVRVQAGPLGKVLQRAVFCGQEERAGKYFPALSPREWVRRTCRAGLAASRSTSSQRRASSSPSRRPQCTASTSRASSLSPRDASRNAPHSSELSGLISSPKKFTASGTGNGPGPYSLNPRPLLYLELPCIMLLCTRGFEFVSAARCVKSWRSTRT